MDMAVNPEGEKAINHVQADNRVRIVVFETGSMPGIVPIPTVSDGGPYKSTQRTTIFARKGMLDKRNRSVVSHASDPDKVFIGKALTATA